MVEHPKCARCGLTITQFHVCPVRETPLERQHRDLSPIPLYPSESPTHPDAPRAGGETPDILAELDRYLDAYRDAIIAEQYAGPEDAATDPDVDRAWERAMHIGDAFRASLLERHRDGERETVCGMRFVVDRTIPPGEIHMRQDGRVVARLINVTDGEVAVGSAPPSPERASK